MIADAWSQLRHRCVLQDPLGGAHLSVLRSLVRKSAQRRQPTHTQAMRARWLQGSPYHHGLDLVFIEFLEVAEAIEVDRDEQSHEKEAGVVEVLKMAVI